jgi:hypothetical protein
MNDDNRDDRNRALEVIPSNQLRLIPLYVVITHIYENIIEKASECEVSCDFFIDQLIKDYGMKPKMATPDNKTYIINEIKRLFPGIKITEIELPSHFPYKSHWRACWEEDTDDIADADGELETSNSENEDDVMLNRAIQLSLNEAKPPEIANTRIMGEKAEERIQKSRQKYKKLYN